VTAWWRIQCDEPGCTAAIASCGESDIIARRNVRADALLRGWRVATDLGVPELAKDLCINHRRPK
jgi:hypothetical protein